MSVSGKATMTLPGTIEKIIPANGFETEKAQISMENADHLYKEIRVENALKNMDGKNVSLKPGAPVEVTIEADGDATIPQK
jgi:hypothetical protein